MDYRRDIQRDNVKRRKEKRQRKKVNNVTKVFLASTVGIIAVVGVMFGTNTFSSPEFQMISDTYINSQNRKELIVAQQSAVRDPERTEGAESAEAGSVGVVNGTLSAKDNGVLITDTSKNPSGLPLYDGWTMSVDTLKKVASKYMEDPNTVKSWDINYKQFWDSDTFKDNPGLYGLGDFTNSKEGSKNLITVGGAKTYGKFKSVAGSLEKVDTSLGSVTLYDGRVLMAVPGRVFTDPTKLTEEILARLRDTCGLTRTSPEKSKRDYSNGCYKVTYNGFENMVHDWGNCVPNNGGMHSVYFDVLFDDGSVLACIMADAKGVHVGGDSRNSWCEDTLMEGYGHVRFNRSDPNKVAYQSALEMYGCSKNNCLDINLSNRKIVGIRTYSVQGMQNNMARTWFKDCKESS